MKPVRTRFAPSPTGFLHVGGVRTALYAFLFARKHGGKFILRIEDTDKAREMEGAIGHIMESLKWLGIVWDEGIDIGGPYQPYLQSSRLKSYVHWAKKLVESGHAYPDPYTENEIEEFRKQAENEKRPFLFRDYRPETHFEWDETTPLRFKVPSIRRYSWVDEARGTLSAGEEALDDFILIKGDGFPTYNFAHVIDDIEMDITHVMRGEEFIPSTPKYLSLYEALGVTPPSYTTMPSILGEAGTKKLSKRDGAKDILDYRTEGYLPEALVNFLALLGWNPGTEQELFSLSELVKAFSLERVQKSGAMFNEEKLLFINREWMRKLSPEEYIERGNLSVKDQDVLLKAIPILKERAHTFGEVQHMLDTELSFLFKEVAPLEKDILVSKTPSETDVLTHLHALLTHMEHLEDDANLEAIKSVLMSYADTITKENGGRGAVLWPLRYALSGLKESPDPFSLIHILGKEESLKRVVSALGILE